MIKFRWEPEFKTTEIGEIPKDWEVKKVGEIIKIKYGKGLPSKNRKEGNVPVFGSSGVIGYHDSFVAKGPGLIIGRKGNIGSVYLSKTNFFPIDTVFYADEVNNADFMYYLLSQVNLQQLMSDSAVPGLNINFLKSVFIPCPPPNEQSRIATVLSWFDNLIENKKRQNEILEKAAMAIFKSWFVDFEPFKDGEFVYNEELDREVPKGWEVKAIGEVAELESGGNAPQSEIYFENGKYPFIRVKHMSTGSTVYSYDLINDKAIERYRLKLYPEGVIFFQKSGESLKKARVNILPFDAYIVNHIAILQPKTQILREFLFHYMKILLFHIVRGESGTALPYINISTVKSKFIPIPPQPILEKFHSLVEPLFQKIILNQKQIMVLRKIRDALLPQLIFGKLRVAEL